MERHRLSKRFHELLALSGELHDKKQADYGTDESPFANVEASQDFGVPGWIGAMIRANDKMKRIQKASRQVIEGGQVDLENEAMENSLFDLAVYCLISYVLYEDEQAGRSLLDDDVVVDEEPSATQPWPRDERYTLPVRLPPRKPLSEYMPHEVLRHFPLKWMDEADDLFRALNTLRAKGYYGPEHFFIPPRTESDEILSDPPTTLWGVPVSLDKSLGPAEFVMRVVTSNRSIEYHHFHFSRFDD